jgi:plasmid maintenance system antidote protein VapI
MLENGRSDEGAQEIDLIGRQVERVVDEHNNLQREVALRCRCAFGME